MAESGALRLADDVNDTVAFSLIDDALKQNEVIPVIAVELY